MLDSLAEVLPAGAQKYGKKTALVCGGRSFSFTELNNLSDRIANGLRGLGVAGGDRVTLYSQNCWEWIVSYYAVVKLGAVINPLNVMLTPEEVLFVVRDCGARIVLASLDKGNPLFAIKSDSPLQEIILFGDEAPAGARTFNELLGKSAPTLDRVSLAPDELSTIAYTSGTTGYPKGAMLTHRNVLVNSAMTANWYLSTPNHS